ncbi:MAG TPA: hypothetical protein VLA03_06830 [Draconibacterium sp.]|nr:hypothetical protein [Draconibacterium sp.]
MKNSICILVFIFLFVSCTKQNKNKTGTYYSDIETQDTLIASKTITGETAGYAYLKRAVEYFAVIKNDTSSFMPLFIESKENSAVSIDLNLPYTNKTETYAQRMSELKLILPTASKEFDFDSLRSLSIGRLILTGDLAVEITKQYKTRFGENEKITTSDYGRISEFLLESNLTKDFNELFEPYSLTVEKIIIEKAFFTNKSDLLNNSAVSKDASEIPEKVLDCIAWVRFKNI